MYFHVFALSKNEVRRSFRGVITLSNPLLPFVFCNICVDMIVYVNNLATAVILSSCVPCIPFEKFKTLYFQEFGTVWPWNDLDMTLKRPWCGTSPKGSSKLGNWLYLVRTPRRVNMSYNIRIYHVFSRFCSVQKWGKKVILWGNYSFNSSTTLRILQ